MTDLQIDYFMAVATNLSFTKTSEELFVSQPAISRQISQLEKELGAKLFRRNNQRTELTEVGRLYFDLFSRFKSEYINTRIKADHIMGKKNAVMRVGFTYEGVRFVRVSDWENTGSLYFVTRQSNHLPQMQKLRVCVARYAEVHASEQ